MKSYKALICYVLTLSLSGCTLSGPLSHHAISYNRTVEKAQNRMLLLNIVRASKRHPTYFTGIGSITAAPSYSISSGKATLTKTISRAMKATTERTVTNMDGNELPSGSFSNKATLQMGVLDDHEFIRGIQGQVSIETVSHYLKQGWEPDILAYLLVERIEITDPECYKLNRGDLNEKSVKSADKKPIYLIENEPGDKKFKYFQKFISEVGRHCDLVNRGKNHPIAVLKKEPSLGDISKAIESGIQLSQRKYGQTIGYKNLLTVSTQRDNWSLQCSQFSAYLGSSLEDAQSQEASSSDGPNEGAKNPPDCRSNKPLDVALILRSTHGIIEYLGEILAIIQRDLKDLKELKCLKNKSEAAAILKEKIPVVRADGEEEPTLPLFWATQDNSSCKDSVLTVKHAGIDYIIPGGSSEDPIPCRNRSMQALAFVSQLLGLHKSSKDLPGTTLVTVNAN